MDDHLSGPSIIAVVVPASQKTFYYFLWSFYASIFCDQCFYTARNKDRAFMNDLSAIFAFSIAGLASCYLGRGIVNLENLIFPFLTSVLFFIGCTFYVKTMIREKKNTRFKWLSWLYHLFVVALWFMSGFWIAAIAFIPSLLRAYFFYGKKLSPLQIGVYEIINSAIIFTILAIQIVILN